MQKVQRFSFTYTIIHNTYTYMVELSKFYELKDWSRIEGYFRSLRTNERSN
jgi:hypothetical protein